MSAASYDAIVIGAGHNGLVAANYLARGGKRVLVLESRDVLGGACTTEELITGAKWSSCAFIAGLLRPEIIAELELKRYGLDLYQGDALGFVLFRDGSHFMMWKELDRTLRELEKYSEKDARRFLDFGLRLQRFAEIMPAVPAHLAAAALGGPGRLRGGGRERAVRRIRPALDPRPARPLLRVRAPQRLPQLLRHGLDLGRPLDPGHQLRLRPPRLGRVQRHLRPVRLRPRRHGLDRQGARQLGRSARGGDQARDPGRRRCWSRTASRSASPPSRGRRVPRPGRRLQRRPAALAADPGRREGARRPSSAPRSRGSTCAARWPASTC